MKPDDLKSELIELTDAFWSDRATDDERARLERLLSDSSEARVLYLRLADDTVSLRDIHYAKQLQHTSSSVLGPHRGIGRVIDRLPRWTLALAASVLTACVGFWWHSVANGPHRVAVVPSEASVTGFARVINASNVSWAPGGKVYRVWDHVGGGDVIAIDKGRIELLYGSGVQVVAQGPAQLEFVDEDTLAASSGKLVARVAEDAIGFRITTPHAQLTDQGTSFGVTIDEGLQTDVVVYEGLVDLEVEADPASGMKRLTAGEALRIDHDGRRRRISTVASDQFLAPPSIGDSDNARPSLIGSVVDNLKPSDTSKGYRVVDEGFREDCVAFVDRRHQWNGVDERGIPPFLRRCDYVMTFNDDKVTTDLQVSVELKRPARLYVLIDDRVHPLPRWLTSGFFDTGWDIGVDEGYIGIETDKQIEVGAGNGIDTTCSVWARDVHAAGPVTLGAPRDPESEPRPWKGKERSFGLLMYGIVAGELPANVRMSDAM